MQMQTFTFFLSSILDTVFVDQIRLYEGENWDFNRAMIFENFSICVVKISGTKFHKSKISDVIFFFILICLSAWDILSGIIWPLLVENGSENCPIFIIQTFYGFRTMFAKYLCDELSKIKNPKCTFFFSCPCQSSWDIICLPFPLVSGQKFA